MFGQFLEIGLRTPDIAASVQFYERLGFAQLTTGDAWPHRYGVVSDGRLHLGLHERDMPTPCVTFVLPELARALQGLRAAHIEPEQIQLGEDSLNELRLRDPCGQAVTLLEARTYSPAARGATRRSLCGYFSHLSLPQSDLDAAREFWERAGFVALPELDQPYPQLPLTSDRLDLAFHQRRTFDAPLLVFESDDTPRRMAQLRDLGVATSSELPRGLDREHCTLIKTPEGAALLLQPDGN